MGHTVALDHHRMASAVPTPTNYERIIMIIFLAAIIATFLLMAIDDNWPGPSGSADNTTVIGD